MASDGDTIVAIASPAGMGAVSLIRLSGPQSCEIAQKVIGFRALPPARKVGLRSIVDAEGLVIDEGLWVTFSGPASYTGEDVAEFTGHGGVMVTRKVIERLIEAGARPAEPGPDFAGAAIGDGTTGRALGSALRGNPGGSSWGDCSSRSLYRFSGGGH